MALSSGAIIAIALISIFILIILLFIIIFIITRKTKTDLNGVCNKCSDCKSGLTCYKGRCKVGLGEKCDNIGDCANHMACIKGVCKKRKRKRIDIDKKGHIEIDTIDSSMSIKQDRNGRSNYVVGVNAETDKNIQYEERWNPDDSMSDHDDNKDCIADICNYSSYTVYLMNNNDFIVTEGDNNRDVVSDIKISHIVNFDGYVYAISEGRLYYLDNNTLENNKWKWIKVPWSPMDIIDMSVPHDRTCIWIRCKDKGYLYSSDGKIIESVDSPYRRTYGVDRHNYISFDHNGDAVLQPGNKPIIKIKDALIDHKGELYILNQSDRYRMMKLVSWKPFYIP
tara:strand:- start:599 stop:1612 length:1014 start_codon:yes stop_codon:yes gene_type:complete